MKLIFHIIKKDLRHLWPLLAAWWALLLAQALFPLWVYYWTVYGQLAYEPSNLTVVLSRLPGGYEGFFPELTLYAYIVHAALLAVIGTKLISAEEPDDDRLHWRVLPLTRSCLISAKLLFLLAFIGLPVTAVDWFEKIFTGLPAETWPVGSMTALCSTLVWALAPPVAMVLVQNTTLRILAFIGLVTLCLAFVAGLPLSPPSVLASRVRFAVIWFVPLCAVIVSLRYLRLSRAGTAICVLLGLTVVWAGLEVEAPLHDKYGPTPVETTRLINPHVLAARQARFVSIPEAYGLNHLGSISPDGKDATFFGGHVGPFTPEFSGALNTTITVPIKGMSDNWRRENSGRHFTVSNQIVLCSLAAPTVPESQIDTLSISASPTRGFRFLQSRSNEGFFTLFGLFTPINGLGPNNAKVAVLGGLGKLLNDLVDDNSPDTFPAAIYSAPMGLTGFTPPSTLDCEVVLSHLTLQAALNVPLEPGAESTDGPYRLNLLAINRNLDKAVVQFNDDIDGNNFVNLTFLTRDATPAPWPMPSLPVKFSSQYFFLWNPKRQESLLILFARLSALNGVTVNNVNYVARKFTATVWFRRHENGQLRPFSPEEMEAWLKDARLVCLTVKSGPIYRGSFTIDPFVPPGQDAATPPSPAP